MANRCFFFSFSRGLFSCFIILMRYPYLAIYIAFGTFQSNLSKIVVENDKNRHRVSEKHLKKIFASLKKLFESNLLCTWASTLIMFNFDQSRIIMISSTKSRRDSFNGLFGEFGKSTKITFTLLFLIFVATLHVFAFIVMPMSYGKNEEIHGHFNENYSRVVQAFKKNFMDGFERDGANFAVFHKNKAVVNLWAGTADSRVGKQWTMQTLNILFSVTKPLSGLCVAVLVDRGYLKFDDPVSKYWPEFAQNGKSKVTVRQILGHEAGLPYIEEMIDFEDAEGNATEVLRKLAAAKPIWDPTSGATGYHPVTFGWLVDGIVRHVDPKKRTLKQFFHEEIANPYNLDITIGGDLDHLNRIAYVTHPSPMEIIRDLIIDPRLFFMYLLTKFQPSEAIIHRVAENPKFIDISQEVFPFNDPRVLQLSIGSATGLATAHDLAKLFALMLDGQLISSSTLEEISKPSIESWHIEKTVIYPLMKGHGFFYDYHPQKTGKYVFGHPGYGCQGLHIDPDNELIIAYLSNGLKTSTSILCLPYQRLIAETYQALKQA
uniref:Beta-lactamase-related domain-containing protein n=1 Tax=Panagrolaimus sp. JU765 TaxID=591449 RepID=A0AC34QKA3_9BILA